MDGTDPRVHAGLRSVARTSSTVARHVFTRRRERRSLAEPRRGRLDLFGRKERPQLRDRPRGHPGPEADRAVVPPRRRCGRVLGELAQDRVHEAPLARDDDPHGLPDRRVGRDPRVQDLVRAEPERGARARRHPFDRSRGARADRVVEPGNVADRPVGELGGERPIPLVEARASQGRRQDPVRVGALVGDPADHLERDLPSARAHVSCSPRWIRAPRAHSAPVMRFRPAGATSSRPTASWREAMDDRRVGFLDADLAPLRGVGQHVPADRASVGSEHLQPAAPERRHGTRLRRERANPTHDRVGRMGPVDRPLVREELRGERRGRVILGHAAPRIHRPVPAGPRRGAAHPAPPAGPRACPRPRRARSTSPPSGGPARCPAPRPSASPSRR